MLDVRTNLNIATIANSYGKDNTDQLAAARSFDKGLRDFWRVRERELEPGRFRHEVLSEVQEGTEMAREIKLVATLEQK